MSKRKSRLWLVALTSMVGSLAFVAPVQALATDLVITTQPSGAVNGVAFTQQPVVELRALGVTDATDSSTTVTAVIASGTGTLSGTTTRTAVKGVVTFTDLAITGTAGNFTLTFTSNPVMTPATSASFALTFGAAVGAAITTQPSGAVNGVAFTQQPVIRIIDSGGNTVTNSTVNVVATIACGVGTLSGVTTRTAVNGVVTFTNLEITGTVGSFTLTFTPTSLTAITSTAFALTFGAASAAAIIIQPSGAVNGVAFTQQPVIRIVDSGGNTVTNSTVNVVATIASGTGTLSGTTTRAAVNGVVAFTNLAITGTAGNFTLTFTPTSLTAITSTAFTLILGPAPAPAPASALAIIIQPSGAVNGVAFTQQPVIRIVDSGGNTVTNSTVNVVASIACGAGTLSGTTTVAAVAGVASFTDLKLTGAPGNFRLAFTSSGLTSVTSVLSTLAQGAVATTTNLVSFVLSPLVENIIDVQLHGTSSNPNTRATINIPKNSTTEITTVKVYAGSDAADVDVGFVSVKVEAVKTSDNSAVTTFANAIEIRISTTATLVSPAWSRDGLTWTLLPGLAQPILPEGQADGYFVNPDGSYSFFTRHLTFFGLRRAQAPLTLVASQNKLNVGRTMALSFTGGSGTGKMVFRSIDPTICSISSEGVLLGSSVGKCSVTVTKLGSGSYLDATSVPIVIVITASTIVVTRRAGITTIKVTLPLRYANKLIRVEWGLRKDGVIFYGSWGNTRANARGVAMLRTTKIITSKTSVRARIGTKVIAKRTVISSVSVLFFARGSF